MSTPNGARYDAIARQIRRLEQRMRQLEQRQERYARLRPGVFLGGLILTYWAGWTAFFIALAVLAVETGHYAYWGRILQRYRVWLNIKQTQLARLTLQWDRIPAPIQHTPDETHPFEFDLSCICSIWRSRAKEAHNCGNGCCKRVPISRQRTRVRRSCGN